MFGPDEYRYFCTELGKVAGTLSDAREKLLILRGELSDDGVQDGYQSQYQMRAATERLQFTLADLDSAVSALPVPTREGR